ncbi:MAG: purine-nucleoside phosphorylase, partial [Clostridia bacterium]|nr:purine-nucleoside phosphorylase [Clostridia bacterium]
MATPHNSANLGDFAKTVLMPGDPKRAKFIVDNFLTDAKLVNDVRGVQGYTGYYKGKKVSVMASGMGIPSFSIYATELYESFGVETIIRVGSAGGLADGVKTKDVVIAQAACTDSNFLSQYKLNGTFAPIGTFELIQKAYVVAKNMGANVRVGNVLSSDVFYCERQAHESWRDMGVLA